jgi:anti-sigma regulatory factor (Ser/Thr protein kinase)
MEKIASGPMQQLFPITHSTDIAAARRAGTQLATEIGLDETITGKLAIIITEAATNILKHAGAGAVVLGVSGPEEQRGVDVLALDKGPGIANLSQSLRDGVSTTGTQGTGLGAISRLSDCFDIYTAPGKGAALYMHVSANPEYGSKDAIQVGAVSLPIPGEDECGDGWAVAHAKGACTVLVVDGLGHGPEAARAARTAELTLHQRADLPPGRLMEAMHTVLRPTRGAAAALASLQVEGNELRFAGIGNIAVCVFSGDQCKHLVSHNGIVGHNMRKVQEFQHGFPEDGLLMMYSDGLSRHWNLSAYPGLQACHPSLIAGVLYRDFSRGRDDVTILVARRTRRILT